MRVTTLDLTDDERREGLACAVLLLGGLDELLLAVPAIRALRGQLPRHEFVLAGHPTIGGAAVTWGIADSWVPARAWHMPRIHDLDVAVDLTGAPPESHRLLLHQRARRLVAAECVEAGVQGPRWSLIAGGDHDLVEHRTARWCRIVAQTFHIDVDPRDGLLAVPGGGARGFGGHLGGDVVLHPGGPAARRWPAPRWVAVAEALASRGLAVRVLGTPGEAGLAADVASAAGLREGAEWLPATVGELTAGIAAARLVVSGDTVAAHLAGALAVPGVHLFGRTSPRERAPLHVARRQVVLHRPDAGDAGHDGAPDPLLALECDDVVDAAVSVVEGAAPPGEGRGRPARARVALVR